MTIALWIIAIIEVIRTIQNTIQLKLLIDDKRRADEMRSKAFEKYAEAMDKSNENRIVTDETDCPWN